jgi:hypothetical protein
MTLLDELSGNSGLSLWKSLKFAYRRLDQNAKIFV